jgi:hypothetical protein
VKPTTWAEAEEKGSLLCGLLRDLFANPFCPVALDPGWRTPTTVSLARAAYADRLLPTGSLAPARLAVLSDALEEAGCPQDHELLLHLHGAEPHVRGCYALDLLLNKA